MSKTPPLRLSWSAISSFEYDPEQWYQSYILGIRQKSKELDFGSLIDQKLQDDPSFLPHVVRYPVSQHKMEAKFGKFQLVGVADAYHPDLPAIRDYKTGKRAWDQKRANETGQLTMYCLLLWLTKKIRPEVVHLFIDWLPTYETGDFKIELINEKNVHVFKTKRTMRQVLEFGVRINSVYKQMQDYCATRAI